MKMNFTLAALAVCAVLTFSCGKGHGSEEWPEDKPNPEQKDTTTTPDPVVEEPKDSVLCAPKNLVLEVKDGNIVLTWEDVCAVESGYLVQRTHGTDVQKQFLKRNSTSYSEAVPGKGTFVYEVCTYSGMDRSESLSVTYEDNATPSLAFASTEVSWQAAGIAVDLQDGCGEKCTVGITVDGKEYIHQDKVSAGEKALFVVNDLEYGKSYEIKAYATNSEGTSWTEAFTARLKDAPSALKVDWTDISSGNGMPSGVSLYKATSNVTGKTVNMWYAIADMSKVALRTTLASTVTTPTDQVKNVLKVDGNVYVTVNGGYFGSPSTSYSHLSDRGVRKAKNISALTRTKSYNLTRGVFGVDNAGAPEVYWVYDESSSSAAYERPLPVIDGGAVLSHSATYPSSKIDWKPYEAVGGAPVLLRDGRIRFDFMKTPDGKYFTNHELLQSDIFAEDLRAPRTAIGATADGKIILFICDGRNSGGSQGLTLDEETRILMGLGCVDALNLDGGGSTAMVVGNDGKLLNSPSDGSERKVLHFVSFVAK